MRRVTPPAAWGSASPTPRSPAIPAASCRTCSIELVRRFRNSLTYSEPTTHGRGSDLAQKFEEAFVRHRRPHLESRLQLRAALRQLERRRYHVRVLFLAQLRLQVDVVPVGEGGRVLDAVL